MSFDRMFESSIPLRDAAEFFMKLKYAENMPQPPMAEPVSSDMDQSVEQQAPDMPVEVAALAELARMKLQAAMTYRVYSESLRDLTNTALGEHFKEHSENELEHADYLIRRCAVMHGPVELGALEPAPPATDVGEILSILMDSERELIAKLQEVHAMVGENPMKYELEAMMVLDQHHFDDLMQHQPAEPASPGPKMAGDIQLPATAMGQQKPIENMPALMGTAAGQQAKIAFQKAAFALTSKGHQFDVERAKLEKETALGQVRLLAKYDAAPAWQNPDGSVTRPKMLNLLRFGTSNPDPLAHARHQDYIVKRHAAGKNAWNPFGGILTPLPQEEGATTGFLSVRGRLKTAAETLDPETVSYLQTEQDAESAVHEAEEGYYRQRFQEAAEQLQATQGQLEQQQQQIQMLEEQAAQHQQQSDEVLMQAQQTQTMASDTAMQAHSVAAQAIQQNQQQSQELIQQMQLSANMRSAIDEMKQQLMQVAMQPSPPTTTVQQAFDMTAPPGMPVEGGQGMEGQMQDPSMEGAPVDPAAAGGAPPGAAPQAQPAPAAPKAPAPAKPPAEAAPAKTASHAQLLGGIAGAGIGAVGTYRESRSDPKVMQQKVKDLERQKAEGGGFSVSMSLAKERMKSALTDVARQHPTGSVLAGTALGAMHGVAMGSAVEGLAGSIKNFNRAPSI